MAPAESSDDKPGHGRPGPVFPGGTEDPMSFDVSRLAGSPYAATSVDRTRRAERSQASFADARRRRRHAADPRRGVGPGRRRRASGRQAEHRGPRGPLRRPPARRRRGRLARGRRGRHAAPAAARGRRRRRPSLARSWARSSRMAGIQIGGIASGMDTESIITQLMSIESAPRTRTARQQVDRAGAPGRAAPDRLQAHQSEARRRRPALGRHLDAHAGGLERQRERPHRAPARRRRPRRLHGQRLLAGQRRLAHLRLQRAAA